jgi:hypothetical protein
MSQPAQHKPGEGYAFRVATYLVRYREAGFKCFHLLQMIAKHNLQGIKFCVIVIVLVLEPTEKQDKWENSTKGGEGSNNC